MTSATRRHDAANERSRLLTNREHLRAALVGRDRGHDYEHRHRDRKRESYRVNGAIVSHSSYVRRSLSFPRERGAAAKQFPGRARPSTGCAPPPRCAMRAHTHSVRTLKREGVPADWRRQLVAEPVLGVLVPLPSWGRDWVAGSALDRSVALAPLMLDERGRPELCERVPLRIVERPDDRLAVRDRQRKGDSSELERLLEDATSRLLKAGQSAPISGREPLRLRTRRGSRARSEQSSRRARCRRAGQSSCTRLRLIPSACRSID